MKKSILFAIIAALPVVAQETAPAPEQAPAAVPAAKIAPARGADKHAAMLEKYDVDKDGKLSDDERETMKKDFEAAMLEKYDADRDGKLSDEEKKAAFEEFRKNHPQGQRGEGRGPRHEGKPGQGRGPRPEGKPGEGRGPRPEGKPGEGRPVPAEVLEKYDVDKDGKLSDDEKETIRKDMMQNRPQGQRREGRGPRHEGKPGRKDGFRHDKRAAKPEVLPAPAPEA